MFKKIAAFTDLHLGHKNNSQIHNQDCVEFIDWFIDNAKKNGCETGICLGDYHHNRNTININTLNVSIQCLEKLSAAFENFYIFPGNHDMFYKDNRNVHSIEWGRHIDNIHVINEIVTIGNTTLVPWLVGDEWKQMKKLKSRYVFGHFEIPNFFMNAQIRMPDHGELQDSHFDGIEYVFSGHFHKRQVSKNIIYIGNAFPHNYADAWDDERGMMILENGGEPQFMNWDNAPKFRIAKLSELKANPTSIIGSKTYLRVSIDESISFEEATSLKSEFMGQYDIRELMMVPERKTDDASATLDVDAFEPVDKIIASQLGAITSTSYDPNILLAIYNSL